MKISDLCKNQKLTFSFEFFPPKTEDGEAKLFETVSYLKKLRPSFCSVTYGAMGTTRDNTLRIAEKIKKEVGIETACHFTCVGHSRDEIEMILNEMIRRGIENIVALRGDPPKGQTEFKPVPNGFKYGSELVRFIRNHPKFAQSFSLAVAGYPEGHLECPDKEEDLEHLKEKVNAGADVVITQLFFDNADFYDFEKKCEKARIKVPIIPGIMPVSNGPQIKRITSMCGSKIPEKLQKAIDRYGDDHVSVEKFGTEYATDQCRQLLAHGIPGIHFYTLNKSHATDHIFHSLSLA